MQFNTINKTMLLIEMNAWSGQNQGEKQCYFSHFNKNFLSFSWQMFLPGETVD